MTSTTKPREFCLLVPVTPNPESVANAPEAFLMHVSSEGLEYIRRFDSAIVLGARKVLANANSFVTPVYSEDLKAMPNFDAPKDFSVEFCGSAKPIALTADGMTAHGDVLENSIESCFIDLRLLKLALEQPFAPENSYFRQCSDELKVIRAFGDFSPAVMTEAIRLAALKTVEVPF